MHSITTAAATASSRDLQAEPKCLMFQTELELPTRFRAAQARVDECTYQKLYLADAEETEWAKAEHVRCLPDTPVYPVDRVGDPRQFQAYRKVRIGDGVVEIGILSLDKGLIHGLLQVDRIAPGKAIPTNSFAAFHLTADELNELISALLRTKLIPLDAKRLNSQQAEAFRARCAEWDLPAKGAVDLDVWRGLNVGRR